MKEEFEVKKSRGFLKFLLIFIILIGLIGMAMYYFFIIDHPKKIFYEAVSNAIEYASNAISSERKIDEVDSFVTDFNVKGQISISDSELKGLTDIVNKVSLDGQVGVDNLSDEVYLNLIAKYDNEEMGNVSIFANEENEYLKLNNLFDKVIKLETDEDEVKQEETVGATIDDYKKLLSSYLGNFRYILGKAKFDKEYIREDEHFIKKVSIIIEEDMVVDFFNKLKEDEEFVLSYSKIQEMTVEEAIESLEEDKKEMLDDRPECISMYMTLIDNEFLKLEEVYEDSSYVLIKEGKKFVFKEYISGIIKSQGYLLIDNREESNILGINMEDVDEGIILDLSIEYAVNYDEEIGELDISNNVDVSQLTENDLNLILDNFSKQKGIVGLFEDLGLTYEELVA